MAICLLGMGGHSMVIQDMFPSHYFGQLYDDANPQAAGTIDEGIDGGWEHDRYVVAIGNNDVRQKLTHRLIANYRRMSEALVHPKAIVSKFTRLNNGTVVMAGAIIQTGTHIGEGVIINTGATVDHDCRIGDFAHICPGVNLAGNVKVGQRTMIGIGSCVIQGITIGDDITVGAGSVVVDDLLEPGLYVGAPARLIKKKAFKR